MLRFATATLVACFALLLLTDDASARCRHGRLFHRHRQPQQQTTGCCTSCAQP